MCAGKREREPMDTPGAHGHSGSQSTAHLWPDGRGIEYAR